MRVGAWGGQATKYDLKSTTKSFGSVLLGLAIKDGMVGLATPVEQPFLPEIGQPQSSAEGIGWREKIRVANLATHTAGFAKPGGLQPLLFEANTGWSYSDGGPNWLADLLTVRYMQDLRTLLRFKVLMPMGIGSDSLVWRRNAYRAKTLHGIERREFGAGISTSVDVMARIGLMLLRGGRWQTNQILPAYYPHLAGARPAGLADLTCFDPEPLRCPGGNARYGLLFWNNNDGHVAGVPLDAYWSWGLGTSFILVIPSLDIVAARAGPSWPGVISETQVEPFIALIAAAVTSGGGTFPPAFDGLQYIATYPDLIQAFGANAEAGAQHYFLTGQGEGRVPDGFDEAAYLANYPDLSRAFGSDTTAATIHYITTGFFEGRTDRILVR